MRSQSLLMMMMMTLTTILVVVLLSQLCSLTNGYTQQKNHHQLPETTSRRLFFQRSIPYVVAAMTILPDASNALDMECVHAKGIGFRRSKLRRKDRQAMQAEINRRSSTLSIRTAIQRNSRSVSASWYAHNPQWLCRCLWQIRSRRLRAMQNFLSGRRQEASQDENL